MGLEGCRNVYWIEQSARALVDVGNNARMLSAVRARASLASTTTSPNEDCYQPHPTTATSSSRDDLLTGTLASPISDCMHSHTFMFTISLWEVSNAVVV